MNKSKSGAVNMIQKWNRILTNWINCYFSENKDKNEELITVETLLRIISHLHKNFNLDESKSSVLEAQSVEEFILEKFPEFRFKNGNIEATNEEDLYMVTSLLLFFVCVNSKDMAIKHAMCSKLSIDDQETILKFNKCLMECATVTFKEVGAAITEACGPERSTVMNETVPETPPALRSLHSEVRRLQAALDAERFDRNYLQDELARTNLRLENLLKVKEQYKLDILNLKAKISLCCGQEVEPRTEGSSDTSSKLRRQLEQLEDKLVDTLSELDYVNHEREIYKEKIEVLKYERDKWLALSRQEGDRADQLVEELQTERQNVQSLRELINELQQHNKLNVMDTSQLECDDPDASIRLPHNLSVCSEVCSNVVEVQLGEERAKIADLKQQIEVLQDKLNELNSKSEHEIQNLKDTLTQRDSEVALLKLDVSKGIEEKNNIESQLNDEIIKLNNNINELEQKLKDNYEISRVNIEKYMLDIQILQEEKLSLLHSLSDETTKLNNVIKGLQNEMETEKNNRMKMKEDYDNHIMKLNEKVLNRNNELVELQNNIIEKSELIEKLHYDLKKEKESKEELSNNCNHEILKLNEMRSVLESDLRHKSEEASTVHVLLEQEIRVTEKLAKEIDEVRSYTVKLEDICKNLEDKNASLLSEINNRDNKLDVIQKDMENLQNTFREEQQKLSQKLSEKNAQIDELQVQVHSESQYILALQNEASQLKEIEIKMKKDIAELNLTITTLKEEIQVKDEIISSLGFQLNDEKNKNCKLTTEFDSLEQEFKKAKVDIEKKILALKTIKSKYDEEIRSLEETLGRNESKVVDLKKNLEAEVEDKTNLQIEINSLKSQIHNLSNDVTTKSSEIINLETCIGKLSKQVDKYKEIIKSTEQLLNDESVKFCELKSNYKSEKAKLISTISTHENLIQQLETQSKFDEGEKTDLRHAKEALENDLQEIVSKKDKLEDEYQVLEHVKDEIVQRNNEIQLLKQSIERKDEEIRIMEIKLDEVIGRSQETLNREIDVLNELEQKKTEIVTQKELEQQLKIEIANLNNDIQKLQKKNSLLLLTLEEDKTNYNAMLKEKELTIEKLEDVYQTEKYTKSQLQSINSKLEDEMKNQSKSSADKLQALNTDIEHLQDSIGKEKAKHDVMTREKVNDIERLENEISCLKTDINYKSSVIEQLRSAIDSDNVTLIDNDKTIQTLQQKIVQLDAKTENLKIEANILRKEKEQLTCENEILCNQLCAEKLSNKELEAVMATLTDEKEILTQKLVEEKSVKDIGEKEKQVLLEEKIQIVEELTEQRKVKNALVEQKEYLEQQLIEEKTSREIIEQEKTKLAGLYSKLENDLIEEKSNKNVIETQRDVLAAEKDSLMMEKERLLSSLTEEKAARDEFENEKNAQLNELIAANEKNVLEIKSKEKQLQNLKDDILRLKADCLKQEEISMQLALTLNNGIEKVFQNIKKGEFLQSNEVLAKLVNVENFNVDDKCNFLVNITNSLINELSLKDNLEKALKHESSALKDMKDKIREKENLIMALQTEVKSLQQEIHQYRTESSIQKENLQTLMESKDRDYQKLQSTNESLGNELNNVKIQLEVKCHSLKEKLIDNENVTEKLKNTYECQINNLNVMITKLTGYLKDKTVELDLIRQEKDKLHEIIEGQTKSIKSLQEDIKQCRQDNERLVSDFDSERLVLKNMVTVTESVMDDQKVSLNKVISEHVKTIEKLQEEIEDLKEHIENVKSESEIKLKEKKSAFAIACNELTQLKSDKEKLERELEELKSEIVVSLKEELTSKESIITSLNVDNKELAETLQTQKEDIAKLQMSNDEEKIKKDSLEVEFQNKVDTLTKTIHEKIEQNNVLENSFKAKVNLNEELENKIKGLEIVIDKLVCDKTNLEQQKCECMGKFDQMLKKIECLTREQEELTKLTQDNTRLHEIIEQNKSVISNLEQKVLLQTEQLDKQRQTVDNEKLNLSNKCALLEEYQIKAEKELDSRQKEIGEKQREIVLLKGELENLQSRVKTLEGDLVSVSRDKDEAVNAIKRELEEQRGLKEKCLNELGMKTATIYELKQKLQDANRIEVITCLKQENRDLIKALDKGDTHSDASAEVGRREARDIRPQVDNTSDLAHSSLDSIKTISDLEKIVYDKNRTITTLQSDLLYLKSLMAESENKLLDVTKELEISKEECEQLSAQLKKIVHQKNEEIADLKRQISKMSATENRASQIIKVSAKYQTIILKRIAEIKTNTILKELTNFSSNCDGEMKRSLHAEAITMEDLENFLETTDKHLRRCSERQLALQKERDRLTEVNKIHEAEIINMKKFLTELSVRYKTFSSIRELYEQKMSRVVSVQRTVRREILSIDGSVSESSVCKLERSYSAIMQNLSECAMALQRWVELSIGRTISPEKIRQAFTSDVERASLASCNLQNASLDVQLGELESSFHKLLEEVSKTKRGEIREAGKSRETESLAATVTEVRAEYEDKLSRMKAKMKQLYQEQIGVYKEKQKEEIAVLERELQRARDKLTTSSKKYEEHIKKLTSELWDVGEKFLMKKDEAEWLRKKQHTGSLMSLQHVHSSGLVPPTRDESFRPSDTHSLRSLPVNTHNKSKSGRALHMSDEEGEVFDNRWLEALQSPSCEPPPGARLSELRWRNSLCPPHLRSCYPAETQFAPALNEDDIKCATNPKLSMAGKSQRKEVGITAYKKPGPPTPSKQAGRLSATDCELRESLRAENEAVSAANRKTSTPSRLRALFRSQRDDRSEGTPRSRRLSNIFRRK